MVLDLLVIWFCKILYKLLRVFGRHGGALPGVYAERLRPGLLNKLTKLPKGVIVISGTNGKTTTTSILTQVLKKQGLKVFTNHSGSNMTRGILATIVRFTTIFGKLNYDIAVLELDEAYAAKLGGDLKPRSVILTNVLRDQLDRFGEIDYTASLLYKLAESATDYVVYNTSDSRLNKIDGMSINAKKISYGYDNRIKQFFVDDNLYMNTSKNIVEQPIMYKLVNLKNKQVYVNKICIDNSSLDGWHNALNLTSVYALCKEIYGDYLDVENFNNLIPPYGRGESVLYKDCILNLQLVKNPAGFKTVMEINKYWPSLIVVNDNIADGRDVSWLWDVDFCQMASRAFVSTSGLRAYDIALRLQYDGIFVQEVNIDVGTSIESLVQQTKNANIFLTYTSMLQVRTYLKKNKAKFGVQ